MCYTIGRGMIIVIRPLCRSEHGFKETPSAPAQLSYREVRDEVTGSIRAHSDPEAQLSMGRIHPAHRRW
jgi:hypothetical protein